MAIIDRTLHLNQCAQMDHSAHLSQVDVIKQRDVRGRKVVSILLTFDSVDARDGFWWKAREASFGALNDLRRFAFPLPSADRKQLFLLSNIRGKHAYDPENNNPADLGRVHPAHAEHVKTEEEETAELVQELKGQSALDKIRYLLCLVLGKNDVDDFVSVPPMIPKPEARGSESA